MAPRPRSPRLDPFTDLAQKSAVLEREMSRQREALARLKELAARSPDRKVLGQGVRRPA